MGKTKLASMAKNVKIGLIKHSPEILTGIGIAGMITTTVLAVKATPKALELIKEDSKHNHDGDSHAYTKQEAVKSCWKCYIPAAVTGTVSIACLIGASSVHIRRNAALATAYKLSETALSEYREQVVEAVGEKKEQDIREKAAKKQLDKHPVDTESVINTGYGNTQCFDPLSARYFISDIDRIKKAENDLNKRMLHDITGYVSVNEFYDELGLPRTDIGDELGWNSEHLIDIDISAHVSTNGKPSLVVGHYNRPKYEYAY